MSLPMNLKLEGRSGHSALICHRVNLIGQDFLCFKFPASGKLFPLNISKEVLIELKISVNQQPRQESRAPS